MISSCTFGSFRLVVTAKPAKPQGRREAFRDGHLAVFEQAGRERDRDRVAVIDDVKLDRLVVQEAEMERQQAEIRAAVAPEGPVAAKTNLAIAVIGQLRQLGRRSSRFPHRRLLRQRRRLLDDIAEAEAFSGPGWRLLSLDGACPCHAGTRQAARAPRGETKPDIEALQPHPLSAQILERR